MIIKGSEYIGLLSCFWLIPCCTCSSQEPETSFIWLKPLWPRNIALGYIISSPSVFVEGTQRYFKILPTQLRTKLRLSLSHKWQTWNNFLLKMVTYPIDHYRKSPMMEKSHKGEFYFLILLILFVLLCVHALETEREREREREREPVRLASASNKSIWVTKIEQTSGYKAWELDFHSLKTGKSDFHTFFSVCHSNITYFKYISSN